MIIVISFIAFNMFFEGSESTEMTSAHIAAGFVMGEPFMLSEPYDFHSSKLLERLSVHGSTFLKHRLVAPPKEV